MKLFKPRPPTNYAEQTHASPSIIVRYPHRVRYRTAIDAFLTAAPSTLLDYGAGDGHVLVEAINQGLASQRIVAYEPVEEYGNKLLANVAEHGMSDRVHLVRDRKESSL